MMFKDYKSIDKECFIECLNPFIKDIKWISLLFESYIYDWIDTMDYEFSSTKKGEQFKGRMLTRFGLQHGEYKSFDSNNRLRIDGYMIDGKKEGEWIFYDNNGNIIVIKNYSNDLLNGEFKTWYKGRKVEEAYFENGKYQGKALYYNDKYDVLWAESNYKDGKFHGVREEYEYLPHLELNRKKRILNYKEGYLHGEYKEWCDGELLIHCFYEDGNVIKAIFIDETKRAKVINSFYINDLRTASLRTSEVNCQS